MSERWWWFCGDWLIPKFFPFIAFRADLWAFARKRLADPTFSPRFMRYDHPFLWGHMIFWRVVFGIQKPQWDWWEMTREILGLSHRDRTNEGKGRFDANV